MNRRLLDSVCKNINQLLGFDKKADIAIEKHFRLTNHNMFLLIWLKGLWTGILFL